MNDTETTQTENLMVHLDQLDKVTFFVITSGGFFGKGPSVDEAVAQAKKAGARNTERCSLNIVVGAEPKDVTFDGFYIHRPMLTKALFIELRTLQSLRRRE